MFHLIQYIMLYWIVLATTAQPISKDQRSGPTDGETGFRLESFLLHRPKRQHVLSYLEVPLKGSTAQKEKN